MVSNIKILVLISLIALSTLTFVNSKIPNLIEIPKTVCNKSTQVEVGCPLLLMGSFMNICCPKPKIGYKVTCKLATCSEEKIQKNTLESTQSYCNMETEVMVFQQIIGAKPICCPKPQPGFRAIFKLNKCTNEMIKTETAIPKIIEIPKTACDEATQVKVYCPELSKGLGICCPIPKIGYNVRCKIDKCAEEKMFYSFLSVKPVPEVKEEVKQIIETKINPQNLFPSTVCNDKTEVKVFCDLIRIRVGAMAICCPKPKPGFRATCNVTSCSEEKEVSNLTFLS